MVSFVIDSFLANGADLHGLPGWGAAVCGLGPVHRPNLHYPARIPEWAATLMMPFREHTREQERRYKVDRECRGNKPRLEEQKLLEEARLLANQEPSPF